MAEMSDPSALAVTRKPRGTRFTSSPWLIQTFTPPGMPLKSREPLRTFSLLKPYSRAAALETRPPNSCASSCMP